MPIHPVRRVAETVGAGARGAVRGAALGALAGGVVGYHTHGPAGALVGAMGGAAGAGPLNAAHHMLNKHRELSSAIAAAKADKQRHIVGLHRREQRFTKAMQLHNAQFEAKHRRIHGRFA